MEYTVITNIESKTKLTKHLTYRSFLFLITYLLIRYMFKNYVNTYLFIPYMIFNLITCIFLLIPSSHNKGRNHLESMLILLNKNKGVYRPYISKEKKEVHDE